MDVLSPRAGRGRPLRPRRPPRWWSSCSPRIPRRARTQRLREILKIDPEALCRKQNRC